MGLRVDCAGMRLLEDGTQPSITPRIVCGGERERDIEIKGKRGLGEGERVGKRAKEHSCVGRGCVCAY